MSPKPAVKQEASGNYVNVFSSAGQQGKNVQPTRYESGVPHKTVVQEV